MRQILFAGAIGLFLTLVGTPLLIKLLGLRGADVTIPYDMICFHELTVTAGFASNPASWRRATALLAAGAVELEPLVREWERAFRASRAGDGVKFVLDPRDAG